MKLGQQGMFGHRIAHRCLRPIMVSCNADSHEANNKAQSPPIQSSVGREGLVLVATSVASALYYFVSIIYYKQRLYSAVAAEEEHV